MRNIRIALCTMMVAVNACATSSSRAIPSGWQIFTSSRYGYSVAYPADWQTSEPKGEWPADQVAAPMASGVDTFYSKKAADDIANRFDYAWMMISMHSVDAGETLEKWADRYPSIFLKPYKDLCKPTEESVKTQIGGEAAILYSYNCSDVHIAHTAMLIHSGQGYIVVMWAPPATDQADRVTFEQFRSSFVFTK